MELFPFQIRAATQIADRFIEYSSAAVPLVRRGKPLKWVPFYQAISAITGAGKTAVLAAAVAQISETMAVRPVVLWLSKGKVVVEQAYENLTDGGKYRELLGAASIAPLSDYRPKDVAATPTSMVYFATVGTFNQKDRETGNLRIHRSEVDTIGTSAWTALAGRSTDAGTRRPLIVVYDEAQNLSDQQTELLMELQPDAFLLASATLRFPLKFSQEVIEPLRGAGYDDSWLTTVLTSAEVVDSGLVKAKVVLAGYNSPMAETIDDMVADFRSAEADAVAASLDFLPKAIYVANTNQLASDTRVADDPRRPFADRQAPPILIWRHLTEVCGIDPDDIAIYASLKMDKDFPAPDGFRLFSGGDKDYERFRSGSYRHIIFNLALQEGWDDPSVYFAYIDRSMDSTVHITQVIGRVLRQPQATHFFSDRLNTASFYVRVDQNQAFNAVLAEVKRGLGGDAPEIQIVSTPPGKRRPIEFPPKQSASVSKAAIDNRRAVQAMTKVIDALPDFSADDLNTHGDGERRRVTHTIGSDVVQDEGWESVGESSRVSARWVFRREIAREYAPAQTAIDTTGTKFDALVGVGSAAFAQVSRSAHESVSAYLESVYLTQQRVNPYWVGSVLADPENLVRFDNSLHDGYDGFNAFELEFATELDRLGNSWARNPPRTGYGIPLVTAGPTSTFYPDFLVWTKDRVLCIDTKGEHIVLGEAARKLLSIADRPDSGPSISVTLVSTGHWGNDGTRRASSGYTLWGLSPGQTLRTKHFDDLTALCFDLVS